MKKIERFGVFGLLALAAGWILLTAIWDRAQQPSEGTAAQKGFLAPDFSLETTSGETIRLSDLHGRPVMINLWASWCLPCRSEMPAMQRVYETYRERGLMVLAVNATDLDVQQNALDFIAQNGLTFPVLWDVDGAAQKLYGTGAFPTSYFINPQGIIEDVVLGGPMPEALLITRIEQILPEAP
jgi:peroxiredoxin